MRPMRAIRPRASFGRWASWALALLGLALAAWIGLRYGPAWFGDPAPDPVPSQAEPAAEAPAGQAPADAPGPAEPTQPTDAPSTDVPPADAPPADEEPAEDSTVEDRPGIEQPIGDPPPAKTKPAKQPPATRPPVAAVASPAPDAVAAKRAEARQKLQAGEALVRTGKHKAAVPILEQALRLDPSLNRVHRALGICYAQLKQPLRACDAYRRYRRGLPAGSKEIPALDNILAGCR